MSVETIEDIFKRELMQHYAERQRLNITTLLTSSYMLLSLLS